MTGSPSDSSPVPAPQTQAPWVLLVDDDETKRYVMGRLLRAGGIRFAEAASGAEGLALMAREPDLVLLDVHLPDLDGFSVCTQIKSNPATADIPVLMISAHFGDPEHKIRGLSGGADGYLAGSIPPEEFIATIRSWMRNRALARAAHQVNRRLRQLQAITSALASTLTVEQAVEAAVRVGRVALDAQVGIAAIDRGSDRLQILGESGVGQQVLDRLHHGIPKDSTLPLARCHRDGEARFWSNLESYRADLGADAAQRLLDSGGQALVTLPLALEGQRLGALGFTFGRPTTFDPADRDFFLAVAAQASQAIARARAYQEAASHRAALEELMGIVGHDLRNPLNAITLSAGLLLRRPGLDEAQRKLVQRISTSAVRSSRIIHELLDVAQARSGGGIHVEPRPTELGAVARGVVEELESANPGRKIQLELTGVAQGEWDSGRLDQVLSNLVGNALQHSPPGTAVRVHCEPTPDGARITVENEGAPIPPDRIPTLFQPFRRGADAREDGHKSVGLGLYIVDQIVRAHGGQVMVRCDQGWVRFIVELPARVPSPAAQG